MGGGWMGDRESKKRWEILGKSCREGKEHVEMVD